VRSAVCSLSFQLFAQLSLRIAELHRAAGVAPAGRALNVPRSNLLAASPNVSVTAVTDLRSPSGFFVSNPRRDSNTGIDFLLFVCDLLEMQVSARVLFVRF